MYDEREHRKHVNKIVEEKFRHQDDPTEVRKAAMAEIYKRRGQLVEAEANAKTAHINGEDWFTAQEEFNLSYPDIAKHDGLWNIAERMEKLQRATNDPRPARERFEHIGEALREFASKPNSDEALHQHSPDEIAVALVQKKATEPSPSEIVDRMRAMRGVK
jgi:hypothetical protein